jgi:hypothetical protein
MSYAVFKFNRNDPDAILDAVSLLTGTVKSNLSMFHTNAYDFNRRSKTQRALIGSVVGWEVGEPFLTFIKFKSKLNSDNLLQTFGDIYVGCILNPPKSDVLLERVKAREAAADFKNLHLVFKPNLKDLDKRFENAELTKREIANLISLYAKCVKPIHEWIDNITKIKQKKTQKFNPLLQKHF